MKLKKGILKTVIVTISLTTMLSCSSDDITETQTTDPNIIITGDEPVKATRAYITGTSFNGQLGASTIIFDLDSKRESSTYVSVENYDDSYTYKLKLAGIHTKTEHVINTKIIKSKQSSQTKVSSVVIPTSVPSKGYYFDLTNLDMEPDLYMAQLIEVNSGEELTVGNVVASDSRLVRFIDSGNTKFYTTVVISSGGSVSSLGHDRSYGIRAEPTNISTQARAHDEIGKDVYISFYDTTTGNLVKSTKTVTSKGSAGDISGNYHTQLNYISPNAFALPGGKTYNVRLEYKVAFTGVIEQYTPFVSYKIKADQQIIIAQ